MTFTPAPKDPNLEPLVRGFTIRGGKPLCGEVVLSGAKNAATKMMIASLLTDESCVLTNFPEIGDTAITRELCEHIGSTIENIPEGIRIHTPTIKSSKVQGLSRRNRLPILALGPLLARTGAAEVPILGGDKIGPRPVDLHLHALTLLGAEIEATNESYHARAPRGLHGAHIQFHFPSVGATENALLAAVCATGRTVLENTAMEPEVIELMKMLQNMGAIIELTRDRTIAIEGVSRLRGVHHEILPDRNETVSFASLGIATGGDVFVRGARQDHLITFLNVVRRMGAEYEVKGDGIRFWCPHDKLSAVNVETATHPGFMTDWQQPLGVLLTQAEGVSEIHETIYEDRFGYAQDLQKMGAEITLFEHCGAFPCRFANQSFVHRATIKGPTLLHGETLYVRDLRAGMAHLMAALVANGESVIHGIEEIDRGYTSIDARLRALGANIKRT